MVRPICRDILFLSRRSEPASREDLPLAQDLQDTLAAHRAECVGMAANMIGINKCVIIVSVGPMDIVMFNPVITSKSGPFEAEEGCLSLDGTRKTTRYQAIRVEYYDTQWKKQHRDFRGWPAQIIQHETDHLNGTII